MSPTNTFARLCLFLLVGAVVAGLASGSGTPLLAVMIVLLILLRMTNFFDRR